MTPSLWDIMPTRVCLWTPVEGEESTTIMKPTNIQDKFAVAVKKKKKLVGHLPKGKTGRSPKLFSTFLKSCDDNCCYVKVTGKAINQGDGMGMKVPCKLLFSAEEKFLRIFRFQLCKQEHT